MGELTVGELSIIKAALTEYAEAFLPAIARHANDSLPIENARAEALALRARVTAELRSAAEKQK